MSLNRRDLVKAALAASALSLGRAAAAPVSSEGPYEASWDSLARHPCPEWFRDALLKCLQGLKFILISGFYGIAGPFSGRGGPWRRCSPA